MDHGPCDIYITFHANHMQHIVSIAIGMARSAADEADLIARAQRGDAEAFSELATQHHRSLYVLALKYSGNHHDAEDLMQDVILNAYRAIHQFKGMSSFRTWLARIMVNSFLNHKRKSDPLAPMKHQEGMTCEEIADTMGTSVGTVKKTLFRVVDRLRQHFAIPAVKG